MAKPNLSPKSVAMNQVEMYSYNCTFWLHALFFRTHKSGTVYCYPGKLRRIRVSNGPSLNSLFTRNNMARLAKSCTWEEREKNHLGFRTLFYVLLKF